ncbi:MAG TPA: flagellar filament capping protein FliD [Methylophilaceae bacterium]|nr:flagellar filament capping protein FliD [Methylophilaceae bacterium]
MGISSAGIGSGLDVESIVTSLMNVEKKPLTAVTTQKTDYQSQISAYGTLKSALSTFQTAVSALSTASKFNAQTVTSGDSTVFTATANGNATVGNYAVNVTQLAQSQKLSLGGFASSSDIVGTGTMTISFGSYDSVGNTFTGNAAKTDVVIPITTANNTLAGVRDAINASNSSVSATIVNDGTTNRLVVTSKDSGEVNTLKITVADDDGNSLDTSGLSRLAYDPTAAAGNGKNLTQLQVAKNALLDIDGIAVVKSSNNITDAIDGVTLNLLKVNTGASVSLGVATDPDKVKASVTAFVDAYNKLDTTLRSLTKYDETGKASGALLGDATARSVITQIKSVMTKAITSSGSLTSLNQIGVTFQRDGQLALDSTKLTTALSTSFSDIAKLFTTSATTSDPQVVYSGSTTKTQAGTYAINVTQLGGGGLTAIGTINGVSGTSNGTNLVGATGDASQGLNVDILGGSTGARGTVTFTIGYAAQLNNLITNLLSDEGIVASRTDGINSSIKRLDKQAESIEVRLAAIEARYRAQFTKLDTLLSSMSTTSTFLTQQIAAINANN